MSLPTIAHQKYLQFLLGRLNYPSGKLLFSIQNFINFARGPSHKFTMLTLSFLKLNQKQYYNVNTKWATSCHPYMVWILLSSAASGMLIDFPEHSNLKNLKTFLPIITHWNWIICSDFYPNPIRKPVRSPFHITTNIHPFLFSPQK